MGKIKLKVKPFPNVEFSKEQGMKILEEASECREAYDRLMKLCEAMDGDDEYRRGAESVGAPEHLCDLFMQEAADTIQAIVNAVSCLCGNEAECLLQEAIDEVTEKNEGRGRYGE